MLLYFFLLFFLCVHTGKDMFLLVNVIVSNALLRFTVYDFCVVCLAVKSQSTTLSERTSFPVTTSTVGGKAQCD